MIDSPVPAWRLNGNSRLGYSARNQIIFFQGREWEYTGELGQNSIRLEMIVRPRIVVSEERRKLLNKLFGNR